MIGQFDANDDGDIRPFLDCASNQSESASGVHFSDLDWFGNTTLHHCFANNEILMPSVCKVLERYPEYAYTRNQFGRIPLHYALDRIHVNYDGVKKLIEVYPAGVSDRDNENKTPYDVAVKWEHSKRIKKLLLDVEPTLDKDMYFKIRYGFLASLYNCMFSSETEPKRNRIYSTNEPDRQYQRDGGIEILDSVVPVPDVVAQMVPLESEGQPTSAVLENQISALTSMGDISEQSSFGNLHTSTSRANLSTKEGRRSSVPDILEEEDYQLGY